MLMVCSYKKLAISKHFTVNQAGTLIELKSLIYSMKTEYIAGAAMQ
jgi:hypothetical protein